MFNPSQLSALSYANGFTLWHYRTGNAAGHVESDGYFNAAASMLRPGDLMFVNAGLETGVRRSASLLVTGNLGGVVKTAVMGGWTPHEDAA